MSVKIVPLEVAVGRGALAALPPQMLQEFRRDFSSPKGRLLVAYAPGKGGIIGCAGFRRVDARTCEVRRLVVNWNEQRRGLGRQLFAALAAEAARAGYVRMVTDVPETIPALLAFYGKLGLTRSAANGSRVRFELALPFPLPPASAARPGSQAA